MKLKTLFLVSLVFVTGCATTTSPNGPTGNTSNANNTAYSLGYSQYGGWGGGIAGNTSNYTPAPGHVHAVGCGHPWVGPGYYRPYPYAGGCRYNCAGRVVTDPYRSWRRHYRQPLPWEVYP